MTIPLGCNQDRGVVRPLQLWFDPEPSDLTACPRGLIIPKVQHTLADLNPYAAQSYLWTETGLGNGSLPHHFAAPYSNTFVYQWQMANAPGFESNYPSWPFYASSIPRGSTTGALRYHALRQQSEARCDTVPQSTFPSTCPGDAPFATSLSNSGIVIRVCSPGAVDRSPWTATRNRQAISEDLWLDVQYNASALGSSWASFTVHCTSNSSLGYFELPSQHNGDVPGPLLDQWPGREDLVSNFHDLTGLMDLHQIPSET
jgi:hypothetical protein